MLYKKRLVALAVSAAVMAPFAAHATNGMNLEGYGPIATGMGGAAMAYDNGTAAVMNNPATLGLMDEGNRLDVALGALSPDISVKHPESGMTWDSASDAFYMPAIGWVQRRGSVAYGVGVFAQGGMGTEYKSNNSPGGAMSAGWIQNNGSQLEQQFASVNTGTAMADAMGLREFSEVSVGRVAFPLVFTPSESFTFGGSLDYVWAGMDLQMAMPGNMLMDMMPGGSQSSGVVGGTLVQGLNQQMGDPQDPTTEGIVGINYGYFDFANSSDYTGEATATGLAGKLGFTFRPSRNFAIGATYHSKTNLDDLKANGATVTMSTLAADGAGNVNQMEDMVFKGDMKVVDFQWPETYALGVAYRPTERLMVVADVKRINWAEVMKDFTMKFTVTAAEDPNMVGAELDATLFQDWEDQTVYQLGFAFDATQALTLRIGANISDNPVPDTRVHYLFPAIIEDHYTAGFGYSFSDASAVNFSLTYAPEVEVTMGEATIAHSQTNWQLMYSHSF